MMPLFAAALRSKVKGWRWHNGGTPNSEIKFIISISCCTGTQRVKLSGFYWKSSTPLCFLLSAVHSPQRKEKKRPLRARVKTCLHVSCVRKRNA